MFDLFAITAAKRSSGEKLPDYTGKYSVAPTTSAVTLATNNKSMTDDVVVLPIPTRTEGGVSEGFTLYIG